MAKGRVVFVVGHANWGKSRASRALTDGNPHRRRIQLGGVAFFIRRMSNDDRPDGFYAFIDCVVPAENPNLIVAFCPQFKERRTRWCLETLREKGYRLFFLVMRQQYGTTQVVTPDEITTLRQYGRVETFEEGQAEDTTRARALRIFIENIVLA